MSTQDRREQERARRREDILLAARNVFAHGGFHRATVEQIAQRAQIAKGTVYLYFPTKEDILAELVLQALDELAGELRLAAEGPLMLDPEQRLRTMAEAYLAFAQRAPDYFRLLSAWDGGGLSEGISTERNVQILEASNRTLALVAHAIADGMARGSFLCASASQAAAVLWAGLNGSLALLAHPIRRTMIATDAPQLFHATLELLICGLTKPPSGPERTHASSHRAPHRTEKEQTE